MKWVEQLPVWFAWSLGNRKGCLDLQNAFGDKVKEVKQVGAIDTSASVSSVNSHLDMLRPAIMSFGGSVEVGPASPTYLQFNA